MRQDINIYQQGDYVESLVPDYYPTTIWIIDWRHADGYFCRSPFSITRHGNDLFLSEKGCVSEPIWFRGTDIMLASMGLIGEAKLRGIEVPTLPEPRRRSW